MGGRVRLALLFMAATTFPGAAAAPLYEGAAPWHYVSIRVEASGFTVSPIRADFTRWTLNVTLHNDREVDVRTDGSGFGLEAWLDSPAATVAGGGPTDHLTLAPLVRHSIPAHGNLSFEFVTDFPRGASVRAVVPGLVLPCSDNRSVDGALSSALAAQPNGTLALDALWPEPGGDRPWGLRCFDLARAACLDGGFQPMVPGDPAPLNWNVETSAPSRRAGLHVEGPAHAFFVAYAGNGSRLLWSGSLHPRFSCPEAGTGARDAGSVSFDANEPECLPPSSPVTLVLVEPNGTVHVERKPLADPGAYACIPPHPVPRPLAHGTPSAATLLSLASMALALACRRLGA